MGQRGTRRRTGTSPKGMTQAGGAVIHGAVVEAGEPPLVDDGPAPVSDIPVPDIPVPASPVRAKDEAGRREARAGTPPLFASDAPWPGDDLLGRRPAAALLAELALHGRAETPFCIGLLGPAGAGKSVFLDQVLRTAERIAAAAAGAGLATPFVADVAVVRIDAAAGAGTAPETLLWSALAERLAETHPGLSETLDRAGSDPHAALRDANRQMDEARKTLDAERRTLDELGAREARVTDMVLETPGSLVDRYARAKRSGLERVQRQFGFRGGDPVGTFKALVHEAADRSGTVSRIGLAVRALYGFPGQRRLVAGVLGLAAVAWLCALARGDEAGWIEALQGLGGKAGPVAAWLAAHLDGLATLQTVAEFLAVALLLLDVVRAARFALPISRGVDLLQQDLEGRRRELASLIAHQTRRVDTLAVDADSAGRRATEAEKRAVEEHATRMGVPLLAGPQAHRTPGARFFTALRRAMTEPLAGRAPPRPRRILVAIDGLDQGPPAAAAALVGAAHRLLGPGTVTVLAADRDHLLAGFGETDPAAAATALARCLQVPYRVGAADEARAARRAYATTLVAGTDGEPAPAADPHVSVLDAPWRETEAAIVEALAPFAGPTPRAVKRFVNLYRVARADPRLRGAGLPAFAALALSLALEAQGGPEDLAGLAQAVRGALPASPPRLLRDALAAVDEASGIALDPADAERGLAVAASYRSRAEPSLDPR